MITLEEEDKKLVELNEMFIKALPSLPTEVESSIYYAKIDCGELKTLKFIARTYTTEV